MLTLNRDPELVDWVLSLEPMHCGSFLSAIGRAAQSADFANYALLRPVLIELKKKYPEYDVPHGEERRKETA